MIDNESSDMSRVIVTEEMTRQLNSVLQTDTSVRLTQTIGDQQIMMSMASFAQQGAHLKSRGHLDVSKALQFKQQAMIVADNK